MSGSGVTISDMQSFVEMNSSDIPISSNIGNVIELGGEDLGDDFGASLISNTRVTSSRSENQPPKSVFGLEPIQDISVGRLDPLESISFDIPSSDNANSFSLPDISVNKDVSSMFTNNQTATGPSISLAAVTRLSPEEERKKKQELINKLNRLETKG